MARFLNSRINIPIEGVTEAVPTIDTNHAQIHEKNAFSLTGSMTVAASDVGAIQINVPTDTTASVTIDMTNATADLTYTAKAVGYAGNDITVTHADPSGVSQALAVTVDGTDITVSLATNGAGAITSTAALVKAAVNAHPEASVLVTCEDEGAGTGVVNAVAETALTGGALKAYVHFQAVGFTINGGPASVSILENYTMDATALAAASTLTAMNHNRINPPDSVLTCLGSLDITATAVPDEDEVTLGTVALAAATTGVNRVGANGGQNEEWVLRPGTPYILAFSNTHNAALTFTYNVFWYEEIAG